MHNELNYIKPGEGKFYENANGLLSYQNGEDYGRVCVIRMFPLKHEEKFLLKLPLYMDTSCHL